MADNEKSDVLDMLRRPHYDGLHRALDDRDTGRAESDEQSCSAFGFLRGVRRPCPGPGTAFC